MNNSAFLGIVQHGRFKPLAAERDTAESLRLTSVAVQAGQSPESGELPLTEYEGSAILVRGMDDGEWIYSAIVVERADLILTAVVQQAFRPAEDGRLHRLTFPLA